MKTKNSASKNPISPHFTVPSFKQMSSVALSLVLILTAAMQGCGGSGGANVKPGAALANLSDNLFDDSYAKVFDRPSANTRYSSTKGADASIEGFWIGETWEHADQGSISTRLRVEKDRMVTAYRCNADGTTATNIVPVRVEADKLVVTGKTDFTYELCGTHKLVNYEANQEIPFLIMGRGLSLVERNGNRAAFTKVGEPTDVALVTTNASQALAAELQKTIAAGFMAFGVANGTYDWLRLNPPGRESTSCLLDPNDAEKNSGDPGIKGTIKIEGKKLISKKTYGGCTLTEELTLTSVDGPIAGLELTSASTQGCQSVRDLNYLNFQRPYDDENLNFTQQKFRFVGVTMKGDYIEFDVSDGGAYSSIPKCFYAKKRA